MITIFKQNGTYFISGTGISSFVIKYRKISFFSHNRNRNHCGKNSKGSDPCSVILWHAWILLLFVFCVGWSPLSLSSKMSIHLWVVITKGIVKHWILTRIIILLYKQILHARTSIRIWELVGISYNYNVVLYKIIIIYYYCINVMQIIILHGACAYGKPEQLFKREVHIHIRAFV